MSDNKLTKSKMKTFDVNKRVGLLNAYSSVREYGEKQNEANTALATNINDLIKRVCYLEDEQLQLTETLHRLADKYVESVKKINTEHENDMRAISTELKALKAELDRVRLSSKLNTGAIDRINKAIAIAEKNNHDNN